MAQEPDFQFFGRRLNELQAEMRTIRGEIAAVRLALADKANNRDIDRINDRIAAFEAHIDNRLDQTERSIEERLTRIEKLLEARPAAANERERLQNQGRHGRQDQASEAE